MCTLILLSRPGHDWPLILGANRDEMAERPWDPPGRHWEDRAGVIAGRDGLAGGSWLGVNEHGLVAGILNRQGTLGPQSGKRSRGELVLEALDHADAHVAADALSALDPTSYRPFNLIIGDNRDIFWLSHRDSGSTGQIKVEKLPPGLSMFTDLERNDMESPRIAAFLPLFSQTSPPDPGADSDQNGWASWETLLGATIDGATDRTTDGAADGAAVKKASESAMSFCREDGFGTLSSSLIALPGGGEKRRNPAWRFAPGPPDKTPFEGIVF
ncbi:MAG: hypothetical protein HOI33_02870 [Rhodospirillaceae bacterium]|jgi:hypothetical protein|nr:hypothetical protein [Rhodospirillaceae bacterium]MBT5751630.1 hypothetical protein [Rhodospirillaceae bacterium]